MKVYLSFDIEVWCNSWAELDQRFPAAFERYIFGRSARGEYALPKTLEILRRHGLRGVFFVEPLFAARFGLAHLRTIVDLIASAGQDVQMHLHPEWTDEIAPPLIDNVSSKRQHLIHYSTAEQTALVGHGKCMLEGVGAGPVTAFRAGSYAANRDTLQALAANGIGIDSSLNVLVEESGSGFRPARGWSPWLRVDGVEEFPIGVFSDGSGRWRPAQIGACSFEELRDALQTAERQGCEHFVIVSHNFEMLKPGTSSPDWVVVRRFERLCAYLQRHPDRYSVGSFQATAKSVSDETETPVPHANRTGTARRWVEQAWRRLT